MNFYIAHLIKHYFIKENITADVIQVSWRPMADAQFSFRQCSFISRFFGFLSNLVYTDQIYYNITSIHKGFKKNKYFKSIQNGWSKMADGNLFIINDIIMTSLLL